MKDTNKKLDELRMKILFAKDNIAFWENLLKFWEKENADLILKETRENGKKEKAAV